MGNVNISEETSQKNPQSIEERLNTLSAGEQVLVQAAVDFVQAGEEGVDAFPDFIASQTRLNEAQARALEAIAGLGARGKFMVAAIGEFFADKAKEAATRRNQNKQESEARIAATQKKADNSIAIAQQNQDEVEIDRLLSPIITQEMLQDNPKLGLALNELKASLRAEKNPQKRRELISDFVAKSTNESLLRTPAQRTALRIYNARNISIGSGYTIEDLTKEDPSNSQAIEAAAVSALADQYKFYDPAAIDAYLRELKDQGKIPESLMPLIKEQISKNATTEANKLIEAFKKGEISDLDELNQKVSDSYVPGSEVAKIVNEYIEQHKNSYFLPDDEADIDLLMGRIGEDESKLSLEERNKRQEEREKKIDEICGKTFSGMPAATQSIFRQMVINNAAGNRARRATIEAKSEALRVEAEAKDFNLNWKRIQLISKYFGPAVLGAGLGVVLSLSGVDAGWIVGLATGGAGLAIGGGKYVFGGGMQEWRNLNAKKARAIADVTEAKEKTINMNAELPVRDARTINLIAELQCRAEVVRKGENITPEQLKERINEMTQKLGTSNIADLTKLARLSVAA